MSSAHELQTSFTAPLFLYALSVHGLRLLVYDALSNIIKDKELTATYLYEKFTSLLTL